MTLLPSGALTTARAVQNQALPETCSVLRLTQSSDGQGGFSEAWGTAGSYSCRAAFASGDESISSGKTADTPGFTFTFAAGTDVRAEDRIRLGSRTFSVQSVSVGSSWQTALRVIATELA